MHARTCRAWLLKYQHVTYHWRYGNAHRYRKQHMAMSLGSQKILSAFETGFEYAKVSPSWWQETVHCCSQRCSCEQKQSVHPVHSKLPVAFLHRHRFSQTWDLSFHYRASDTPGPAILCQSICQDQTIGKYYHLTLICHSSCLDDFFQLLWVLAVHSCRSAGAVLQC